MQTIFLWCKLIGYTGISSAMQFKFIFHMFNRKYNKQQCRGTEHMKEAGKIMYAIILLKFTDFTVCNICLWVSSYDFIYCIYCTDKINCFNSTSHPFQIQHILCIPHVSLPYQNTCMIFPHTSFSKIFQ